jgi:hypothetical protein
MADEVQITVIATGFDASAASPASARPATAPTQKTKTIEFPLRNFDKDDVDIPAFLRRKTQQ